MNSRVRVFCLLFVIDARSIHKIEVYATSTVPDSGPMKGQHRVRCKFYFSRVAFQTRCIV